VDNRTAFNTTKLKFSHRVDVLDLAGRLSLLLPLRFDTGEILNNLNILKIEISPKLKGKRALIVAGILLALTGAVWAFQGVGMLRTGSFMDNNSTYIYLGSALAVLGVLLLSFGVIPRQGGQKVPAN